MNPQLLVVLVSLSIAAVAGVIWAMWRLPPSGADHDGWAPWLALGSCWLGLAGLAVSGLLWVVAAPDLWLPAALLLLDPGAIAAGVLVLWIYRGRPEDAPPMSLQKQQARVGIGLGVAAAGVGYVFVACRFVG